MDVHIDAVLLVRSVLKLHSENCGETDVKYLLQGARLALILQPLLREQLIAI